MIDQNIVNLAKDSTEEDELSTSIGSSDNENGSTSSDDDPPSPSTKDWRFLHQALAPPPGLLLEPCRTQNLFLSTAEFRPPPGLCLHHPEVASQRLTVDATMQPPGFEACSYPPGVFFQHSQKDALAIQTAPVSVAQARRTRGRKQASAKVAPAMLLPTECPKPQCAATTPPAAFREFDQAVYRKELSDVLRDLRTGNNVAIAVRRIRAQNVPRERQAPEFCDILTRTAEETQGSVRRLYFAFVTGLIAGAFAREECLAGVQSFFDDVFEELASEVPRLRNKLANELVPTLSTSFSAEEMGRVLPHDCRHVQC